MKTLARTALTLALVGSTLALPAPSVAGPDLDALHAATVLRPAGIEQPCVQTFGGLGCGEDGAGAPSATAAGPELEVRGVLPTVRGWAAVEPHADGWAYIGSHGDVGVMGAGGDLRWSRAGVSLLEDWGATGATALPIHRMGASPLNALVRTSDATYALGDLTGDGAEDVVITGTYRERRPDGRVFHTSGMNILDGASGESLGYRLLDGYLTHVAIEGDLVLVAAESGDERQPGSLLPWEGRDGTTSAIHAVRVIADPEVRVEDAWTFTAGQAWARWFGIRSTSGGLAVSSSTGAGGTVRMLDPATGEARWSQGTSGWPRDLRFDAGRDRLIVHVQQDPSAGAVRDFAYTIEAVSPDDGAATVLVEDDDGYLFDLEVLDATGDGAADLVIAELEAATEAATGVATDRVAVLDGADGATVWEDESFGPLVPDTYGVAGGRPTTYSVATVGVDGSTLVVAAGLLNLEREQVRAFDGATGALAWQEVRGDGAFPLFLSSRDGVLATATDGFLLRLHDAATGAVTTTGAPLGDAYDTRILDLNGDGAADLLAAGPNGVTVLDGRALPGEAVPLWHQPTRGPGRELLLADLDGDGADEIAVAATYAVETFELDGTRRWTVPMDETFVWTLASADGDGDGDQDVIVPTSAITALDGTTGAQLWEHGDRGERAVHYSDAGIAGGRVVASWIVNPPGVLAPRYQAGVVAIDAGDGTLAWRDDIVANQMYPLLWQGVETWVEDGTPVAAVARRQRATGALNGRPIVVDVYDVATGEVVYTPPPVDESTHAALLRVEGELVELNWASFMRLREGETLVTEVEPLMDVTFPRLSDGSRVAVGSVSDVVAFPAGTATGEAGANPQPTDRWDAWLSTGEVEAGDLDGDGDDEVVASFFDWTSFTVVGLFYGLQVQQGDVLPHGIGIVDITP